MADNRKKILFILRHAPHGTKLTQEAFDILLMASSFDHEISLIFLNDGIFNLLKDQSATILGDKNFTSAYKALPLYDVKQIYITAQDLTERGIKIDDLFLTPELLTDDEIKKLMQQQDAIFNF